MELQKLRSKCKPHLWFQLYWILYIVWFFWVDNRNVEPQTIIHVALDDLIPFNEWFIFPYCSWFALLVAVLALLWWNDTASYDKLCLMMFSGMTFCLTLYVFWSNGLDIRPTAEQVSRDNIAMDIMQLIWRADTSNNVCPSIHCQSSACMALAFSQSKLCVGHTERKVIAWLWCALICASTVFTKQHSIVDVVCGLALVVVWAPILYRRPRCT